MMVPITFRSRISLSLRLAQSASNRRPLRAGVCSFKNPSTTRLIRGPNSRHLLSGPAPGAASAGQGPRVEAQAPA